MPRQEATSDVAADSPARRRGPKPLLSMEQEAQLVQWVLTQQRAGQRVSRDGVISQAQEILQKDESQDQEIKSTQKLGMGWCNRFTARHPELSLRSGGAAAAKAQVSPLNQDPTLNMTLSDNMLSDAVEGQVELSLKTSETVKQSETMQDEADDAVQPVKTRKYNRNHMEAAVEMYLAGRPMSEVTQRFPLLHQRTIRRRVLRVQRGEVDKRRGPRPLLEGEPEEELVAWILDMQNRGTKVTKKDILARANEQYRALTGGQGEENKLKEGWLRRFKERHPVLSGRAPTCARKEEDESSTEEDKHPRGDGELLDNAQSTEERQEVVVSEGEEKRVSRQKRSEAPMSEAEGKAVSPKRQKTQEHVTIDSTKTTNPSESTRRGSILRERRQSGKAGNIEKLDVIMQSNKRLEEMQRQQLEMLQQLCASNNTVLSSIAGNRRSTNAD